MLSSSCCTYVTTYMTNSRHCLLFLIIHQHILIGSWLNNVVQTTTSLPIGAVTTMLSGVPWMFSVDIELSGFLLMRSWLVFDASESYFRMPINFLLPNRHRTLIAQHSADLGHAQPIYIHPKCVLVLLLKRTHNPKRHKQHFSK